MKKKKILAVVTAVCCICTLPTANIVFAYGAENHDNVIEQSLVLPEDTISTDKELRAFLWDSETNTRKINAYTALKSDHKTIEVHSVEPAILETVKAFVQENGLNENLIEYIIDDEEEQLTGDDETTTPITNDELETLVTTLQTLNTFLYDKGFTDNSAYASLYWGKHSIECYAQSYAVEYEIKQYMKENDIDENLITVIVAPEADYHEPTGGQRSYEEVNTIVAGEYITLKKYLSDNGILSNVYLTTKGELDFPKVPYSCVEIYVRSQKDADKLKAYMEDNYYWQDVVEVTVQTDLSADTDSIIHNKEHICLEGDSNDDGEFGVADVIKLQKYLIAADSMNDRETIASDVVQNGKVDVFDLVSVKNTLFNKN